MTNEQIQQMVYSLNEKAGIHWTNEDKIKFAELIIGECIQSVYDDGQDAEYYQNRIKNHFGVE
jgi:hypothetical protein